MPFWIDLGCDLGTILNPFGGPNRPKFGLRCSSERDIIQNVVLTAIDRDRQPISSIMRPVYEIMEESNSIGDLINILSISGHRHVPLRLKDGGFGLVTIRQILRFIHDTVEQVEKRK